ncbi:MAG: hypothetical protein ABGX16_05590 [Pirellulales bacterium]
MNVSPDGKQITYHNSYKIYLANSDGSDATLVDTGNPFNFGPIWSPDGEWLFFLSGEHYNCHPYVVWRDGTGLRKLADRQDYRGVIECLDKPSFHSASSDVPVWSVDGKAIIFTAKVDKNVEIMRAELSGKVTQLTRSSQGSPNGFSRWCLADVWFKAFWNSPVLCDARRGR